MPRRVSDEQKRFWRDLVERQPTSGLNIARSHKTCRQVLAHVIIPLGKICR